jgi:hypothetical protein
MWLLPCGVAHTCNNSYRIAATHCECCFRSLRFRHAREYVRVYVCATLVCWLFRIVTVWVLRPSCGDGSWYA